MAKSSNKLIDLDFYYKGAPRGPLIDFKAIILANVLTYLRDALTDHNVIKMDDRGISYWGDAGVFEMYIGKDNLSLRYSPEFPAHRPLLVVYEYLEGYVDVISEVLVMEGYYATHIASH